MLPPGRATAGKRTEKSKGDWDVYREGCSAPAEILPLPRIVLNERRVAGARLEVPRRVKGDNSRSRIDTSAPRAIFFYLSVELSPLPRCAVYFRPAKNTEDKKRHISGGIYPLPAVFRLSRVARRGIAH